MLKRFWFLAVFILLFTSVVASQTPRTGDNRPPPGGDRSHDNQETSRLPDDMRIKMAIARAEEDYKKVLEDVEKLSNLAGEIVKGYGERKQLSSDDMRKLGTIEKLAKRVLTQSGGEEVDPKSNELERMPLADAIDQLGVASANIRKAMTAETRFVVSATVIANSNELISLSRFIRRAKKTE